MNEPAYQLTCHFIGGAKLPVGEFPTHELALYAARFFVQFLQEEHKAHRTGMTFDAAIIDADTISVTRNDPKNRYRPTGLYLVLKIKEIKEIEYNHDWQRNEIASEHVRSQKED
jgi:hypothetical protein